MKIGGFSWKDTFTFFSLKVAHPVASRPPPAVHADAMRLIIVPPEARSMMRIAPMPSPLHRAVTSCPQPGRIGRGHFIAGLNHHAAGVADDGLVAAEVRHMHKGVVEGSEIDTIPKTINPSESRDQRRRRPRERG